MSPAWFLLLPKDPARALTRAADAVASVSKRLTRFDAMRLLRTEGGLVPVALERDEAQRCAGALSRAGIIALAVPAERLAWPSPPRILAAATPAPEGLDVASAPGATPHRLPWQLIRALRVARVQPGHAYDLRRFLLRPTIAAPPEPAVEGEEEGGFGREDLKEIGAALASEAISWVLEFPLADAIGLARHVARMSDADRQQEVATQEEPVPATPIVRTPEVWLDLVGIHPPLRFRVRRGAFDYAGLGAGRSLSSRANFASLLRALIARLPDAARDGRIDEALAQRLPDDAPPEEAQEEWQHDLALVGLCTRLALQGR